ncbi:MAG: hypothetical protein ABIM99_00685 [Candidatus Dojkabacteria bacterium]
MNQNPATAITDPKILEILKAVEKFDFKFFGLSETKEPLVLAPNGQVVTLEVAYTFVKTKLIEPAQNGAGPEAMPNMPVAPETIPQQSDSNIEKNLEVEKQPEKTTETLATNPQSDVTVRAIAPKQAVMEPKIDLPFGDGFYPKAFDPTDVNKAQSFIASNAQKDDKSSEKWLSVLWDKFIKELSESN